MSLRSIIIRADRDSQAQVWVATSDDLSGLATEAPTFEALSRKLLLMIPELIELNGFDTTLAEIPVYIIAHHVERVRNPRVA